MGLLEKLLNSDGGDYRGAHIPCGQGHAAAFVGYRNKQLLTVLSGVNVLRAYYHCPSCQSGFLPKDHELDIVGVSLSPGVRRMMGRVGGKESFEQGREDLQELAGVVVKTKHVERISEELGTQMKPCRSKSENPCSPARSYRCFLRCRNCISPSMAPEYRWSPARPRGAAGNRKAGRPKPARQDRLRVHPDESGRSGLSHSGRGIHHLCWCHRGSRGLRQAHLCRGIDEVLDRPRRSLSWETERLDWGIVALHFPFATQIVDLYHAGAFGQSGQSRLWAHQCPGQTMGSGLLATTRWR